MLKNNKEIFLSILYFPLLFLSLFLFFPLYDGKILKQLLKYSGYCSLSLLIFVLSINPLLFVFPSWETLKFVNRYRRLIGVAAFVYALIHLMTFGMQLMIKIGYFPFEILFVHPLILPGTLAFLILMYLTWTSRNSCVRKLGWTEWKKRHRSVYAAEALALLHVCIIGGSLRRLWIVLFCGLILLQLLRYISARDAHN